MTKARDYRIPQQHGKLRHGNLLSLMACVYCYGCGDDITAKCTNRYNMTSSSCARAVPIWKKKFNDVIHSKRLNINIDELLKADLSGGRMCRPCVSAFERLDNLERSVISNLTNAIDSIVSGPISIYPCTTGLNFASSQDVVSPDVAVSFLLQIL